MGWSEMIVTAFIAFCTALVVGHMVDDAFTAYSRAALVQEDTDAR